MPVEARMVSQGDLWGESCLADLIFLFLQELFVCGRQILAPTMDCGNQPTVKVQTLAG